MHRIDPPETRFQVWQHSKLLQTYETLDQVIDYIERREENLNITLKEKT